MTLFIKNGNKLFYPSVLDGVKWTTERKGSPGVLNFTIYADETLIIDEGNTVGFEIDGYKVFYGLVFTKKRTKGNVIDVTAYDQLRYLKNKDTYTYENKTASEVIKVAASNNNLNAGIIADTEYVIPSRDEDNQTWLDIIYSALEITLDMKSKVYTLFDDYGKLTLTSMEDMTIDLLICDQSGENYDYTSSIDTNTYNKIKLIYDNETTKKREVFIAKDSSTINEWGVLQYHEAISADKKTDIEQIRAAAKVKASILLSLYNQKSKSLSFKNLFGDVRARAGARVWVNINLGDIVLDNYMLINKAVHTFTNDIHTMDLELIGGGIYSI